MVRSAPQRSGPRPSRSTFPRFCARSGESSPSRCKPPGRSAFLALLIPPCFSSPVGFPLDMPPGCLAHPGPHGYGRRSKSLVMILRAISAKATYRPVRCAASFRAMIASTSPVDGDRRYRSVAAFAASRVRCCSTSTHARSATESRSAGVMLDPPPGARRRPGARVHRARRRVLPGNLAGCRRGATPQWSRGGEGRAR